MRELTLAEIDEQLAEQLPSRELMGSCCRPSCCNPCAVKVEVTVCVQICV
jgi:hypothetical protein